MTALLTLTLLTVLTLLTTTSGNQEFDETKYLNVALYKRTAVSSGEGADSPVDGRLPVDFEYGLCTLTTITDPKPWWKVDLGAVYHVHFIRLTNRQDCCRERLADFEVRVGVKSKLEKNELCHYQSAAVDRQLLIDCRNTTGGNRISIQKVERNIFETNNRALTLCEVEVFTQLLGVHGLSNVALGRPTKVSSEARRGRHGEDAVDGWRRQYVDVCTHSVKKDLEPWWKVQLEDLHLIHYIRVFNRLDCCFRRLSGFDVRVQTYRDEQLLADKLCHQQVAAVGSYALFKCGCPLVGNAVIIQKAKSSDEILSLCEVEVFAAQYPTKSEFVAISRDRMSAHRDIIPPFPVSSVLECQRSCKQYWEICTEMAVCDVDGVKQCHLKFEDETTCGYGVTAHKAGCTQYKKVTEQPGQC